jgi:hypothetical protein
MNFHHPSATTLTYTFFSSSSYHVMAARKGDNFFFSPSMWDKSFFPMSCYDVVEVVVVVVKKRAYYERAKRKWERRCEKRKIHFVYGACVLNTLRATSNESHVSATLIYLRLLISKDRLRAREKIQTKKLNFYRNILQQPIRECGGEELENELSTYTQVHVLHPSLRYIFSLSRSLSIHISVLRMLSLESVDSKCER